MKNLLKAAKEMWNSPSFRKTDREIQTWILWFAICTLPNCPREFVDHSFTHCFKANRSIFKNLVIFWPPCTESKTFIGHTNNSRFAVEFRRFYPSGFFYYTNIVAEANVEKQSIPVWKEWWRWLPVSYCLMLVDCCINKTKQFCVGIKQFCVEVRHQALKPWKLTVCGNNIRIRGRNPHTIEFKGNDVFKRWNCYIS